MKVVACPNCDTRYRLDPAKFDKPRLRIRCKKCGEPFTVDLSEPEDSAAAAPAPPVAAPPAAPTTPSGAGTPAATASAAGAPSSVGATAGTATILVAHANPEVAEEIRQQVSGHAATVHVTDNGVDALMFIETHKPQLAILDVALPKMFGFEVCEIVRRDEELADVKVVLVAAIYDESRYKRPPSSLYGADDYVEKHRIPEELSAKVQSLLGGRTSSAAATSAPSAPVEPRAQQPAQQQVQTPAQDQAPTPPPAAPDSPAAQQAPAIDEQTLERARRLARTIISDIALYNTEKIDQAIAGGDPEDILREELAEGEQLFVERIAPEVRSVEPFLRNALLAYIENKRQEAGQ